jgi:hypothetical protein
VTGESGARLRAADPNATKELTLPGGCRCPGAPHAADVATIRTQLGHGEEGAISVAGWMATGGVYYSQPAAKAMFIAIGVRSWNLLAADGKPLPITTVGANLLDAETFEFLAAELDQAMTDSRKPLPNPSAAPSEPSSPESGSPSPEAG